MDQFYYDPQKNSFTFSDGPFIISQLYLDDGTATNPSLAFQDDQDTGLYRPSANTLGITCGGVQRATISSAGIQSAYDIQGLTFKFDTDNTNYFDYDSGGNRIRTIINGLSKFSVSDTLTGSINPIHIPAGTLSNLALAFITDTNTGFYSGTADEIDVACNGIRSINFSFYGIKTGNGGLGSASYSFLDEVTTGMYKSATGNLDFASGGNRALNLTAAGCRTIGGSNLAPSYSFISDTDTGIYSISANSMGFAAGGNLCAYVSGTDFVAQSRILINSMGVVGAPAFSFLGDTNTGLYQSVLDSIDMAAGGVRIMNFNSVGALLGLDGSAPGPSLAFISDPDTGIYRPGVNRFAIGCGGALCSEFTTGYIANAVPIYAYTGGASTPGYSFGGDTSTGFYWNGSSQIGISQAGAARWLFNSSYNFQPAATNTYDIGTSSVLLRDCYSTRFLASDGSASTPSITFLSDTDTGLYRPENNALAVTCAGALVFGCYQTVTKSFNVFQNSDGSASIPSYSFLNNNNLGMYRSAANTLTFATNGTGRVSINTANLISDIPIIGPSGSQSAPSYTFNSDTNTGLYSYSADQIGIACGGTLVGRFFNAGFIMNGNIFTDLTPSGGTLHWYLRTNGSVLRNAIGMSATESGSDTGSNLAFWNYTDAGAFKAQIYENERSTNNNYLWGRLWVGQTSSTTIPSIGFLNQTDCGFSSYYTDQIDLITNSVHRFSITNNSILPAADASYNLGSSGLRMNTIYASVGAINTSDRNLKENITDCPLGLEFINKLKPKKYKWKNRTYEEKYYDEETKEEKTRTIEKVHSRYHMGLIAQDIKETLDELEISTNDFAGYVDSSVNEPGINTLGLNYTQFIAPIIRSIQELSQKINDIESRLN